MVKSNLNRNERSLLSCLLCCILPLEVETGRYIRTDREEIFCKTCAKEEVENEVHLVFECPKLKDTQQIFLKLILLSSRETKDRSNTEKFAWLLKKENIKEFSKALTQIYHDRQSKLYKSNL